MLRDSNLLRCKGFVQSQAVTLENRFSPRAGTGFDLLPDASEAIPLNKDAGLGTTSAPRKAELLQNLGQQRLQFDTQGEVRGFERQAGMIEAHGSVAAGINASANVFSTAAENTLTAFQQFSQQNVTNQRELREVFTRETSNLRQELNILKSQVRHMRNP